VTRLAVLPLLALLVACSPSSGTATRAKAPPAAPSFVYAAIGASETVGIGTRDPTRESFPQQLFQRLGAGSVFYDFGFPGETTENALRDELPAALAVRPTLATVWLNVDDLVASVSVEEYEPQLDQLVAGLRKAGARVLLANTPYLDHLPAYAACRPNPPPGAPCPLSGITLPPPDQANALTGAYNAAIARVAAREGATLVDLHAAGQVPDQHPEYVGSDGFHPSADGATAIASTFATAPGLPALPSPSPPA